MILMPRLPTLLLAATALLPAQQLVNSGKPMRISAECKQDDLQSLGLSCSEDEPCPAYLELNAVEAVGSRIFLAGNIHTATVTLSSILLASADDGKTWMEPYERVRFAALEQILVAMKGEAADEAARVDADRQFHRYIAAKLANKVLLRLLMGLFDQRDTPLARQFATDFDNPKTWTAVLAEHRRIVSALAARDPERARKAMRDHLRKSHNRWAQDVERDNGANLSDARRRVSTDGDGLAPAG